MPRNITDEYYASMYLTQDLHSGGIENNEEYLQINACGYFDVEMPTFAINHPEGRTDYYLAYQYAGKSWVKNEERTYTVKNGDVFIYRPGDSQTFWHDKQDNIKIYWVYFTGYGAERLLQRLELASGIPYSVGFIPEIGDLIKKIILELNGKRQSSGLYACALLQQIVAIISRRLKEIVPVRLFARNESVYKSLEYIQKHFTEPLSVQDLAAMSCQSHNHYTNTFQELTGKTPQHYIILLRLQKAKELMQLTDWGVGQIAAAVGYEDQMYFSRIFKRYMQVSPTEYVKRISTRTKRALDNSDWRSSSRSNANDTSLGTQNKKQ